MSRTDLDSPTLDRGIEMVDYDPFTRPDDPCDVQTKRRDPLTRMMRFYRTAKRTAWNIDELPWDEAPVPRFESERWNLLWSSVVQQQLQADQTAVAAASRLLLDVPDVEARLYYTTMVQDEARHLEGWTRLAEMLQPVDAFNPYFEELSQMLAESEMIEERVLVFQVLFEGCALEAFREISKATEKTILGAMSNKLLVDDAIHHRSGVTYEEHLLSKASPSMKRHLSDVLKNYTPVYVANLQWRPPVRQWLSRTLAEHDKYVVERNKALINRAMTDLGLAAAF